MNKYFKFTHFLFYLFKKTASSDVFIVSWTKTV